jgi:hypothetical protein
MSHPAKTVFVFGCYVLALTTSLILIPTLVLDLFQLPPAGVWIRVAGVPLFIWGVSDLVAARSELRPYITWSVPLHASVIVFFGAFVLAGLVQPAFLILGAVHLGGALWTWSALRSPRHAAALPG